MSDEDEDGDGDGWAMSPMKRKKEDEHGGISHETYHKENNNNVIYIYSGSE